MLSMMQLCVSVSVRVRACVHAFVHVSACIFIVHACMRILCIPRNLRCSEF